VTRQSTERTVQPSSTPASIRKSHILVVEDDTEVSGAIKCYLEAEGYDVSTVNSVARMRIEITIKSTKVDLILLDVGLPDEDGWSALRWLRARGPVPVVIVSGRSDMIDRVVGLELGADDYLVKPFELRELLARIRSVQRRTLQAANTEVGGDSTLSFGEWVLDMTIQQLRAEDGTIVHLTVAEYRIVVLLAQNPRKVLSRDQLMGAIMERSWAHYDRSVDVHVSNLRRKIDRDPSRPSLIRAVRGNGYMFVPNCGVGAEV